MKTTNIAVKKNLDPKESLVTTLFWIIGLTIGILFCIFIPYGAGFDEEEHAVRIIDISSFHFLPNSYPPGTPYVWTEIINNSYQRGNFQEPAWRQFDKIKFLQIGKIDSLIPHTSRSIYSPIIFLPQAIVAGVIWRLFSFPILPGLILCRITGLIFYLLGSYLALRWMPIGKWLFLVLILSPTALFQASTLNADGYTQSVSFILISLVVNIALDQEARIKKWKLWAVVVACLLLGMAKPGAIALLPVLFLIPLSKLKPKSRGFLLLGAVFLSVIIHFGWMLLVVPTSQFGDAGSDNLGATLGVMLETPGEVISLFFSWLITGVESFYTSWVGVYGYWVGMVPKIIYYLYPVAIACGILAEKRAPLLTRNQRVLLFVFCLISTLGVLAMYFITIYPPDMINPLRQGRYLTPLAPLLFLPLLGLWNFRRVNSKKFSHLTTGILVGILVIFSFGLYATYYTYCGSGYYTLRPCLQPVYKNMDEETTPILYLASGQRLEQEFTSACGNVMEIQIYPREIPLSRVGSLRISLVDGTGQVLVNDQFPLTSITPMRYFSVPVDPTRTQKGPGYLITILADGMEPDETIGLARSATNFYYKGDLFLAGNQMGFLLIYRYTCQNPWQAVFSP